jgi:hypothetical protein
MKIKSAPLHCPCDGAHFATVFTYDAPPEGEVRFRFSLSGRCCREVLRCGLCGHFVSVHNMDTSALYYMGDYVSSNYDDDGESGVPSSGLFRLTRPIRIMWVRLGGSLNLRRCIFRHQPRRIVRRRFWTWALAYAYFYTE